MAAWVSYGCSVCGVLSAVVFAHCTVHPIQSAPHTVHRKTFLRACMSTALHTVCAVACAALQGVKFSLFDAKHVAQRGVVRDFSIVGIKAHDGRWFGVDGEGQLRANRHSITDGAAVHFSIFKIHAKHPQRPHCAR